MDLKKELDHWYELHEKIFEISRRIRIKASEFIAAFHRKQKKELPDADVKNLLEVLKKDPQVLWHSSGSILIALQEYVEAVALKEIIENNRLPALGDIPPNAYLLGLADVVGELKRYFLERLIEGNFEEARRILERAKELFDFISSFHYPDAVVPGFRRKKDVARALINSMLHIYAEAKIRG